LIVPCTLALACNAAPATTSTLAAGAPNKAVASVRGPRLLDWPEFGLDPQRTDATARPTGITAANVGHLRRIRISLPGTVDSSPIYVHGVSAGGAVRNLVVVDTTYGKTIAIDASGGAKVWTFTPPGFQSWAGSDQITVSTPLADPDHRWVYTASPDGRIHKLSLSSGAEQRTAGWPAAVTREPIHEKLGSALNIDGPYVIATTSGYYGDAPPYQGHVALIDRASGRIRAIFNTLCADRRELIVPASCSSSDSAILSRGGAVVEPGGRRLLVSTGNGPWNGRTDFGDSVLELSVPSLSLRQSFTPSNQAYLNSNDVDLGSSAPALAGPGRVIVGGKDGILRVLERSHLDGRRPSTPEPLGGEVQGLALAGGGQLFTAPAVRATRAGTAVFIGDEAATAEYVVRGGRMRLAWQSSTPGTSPVLAGGLLYVYDPASGGIDVYEPSSPHPIAHLPGSPGHWNSPIVVDGHVIEPEGDANEHSLDGTLDLFSAS
jgi:hypothetical protein